jgi:CBS domain containing-hemolysin-like protein
MISEAKRFKVLDDGEENFGYQILKFGKIKVSEIMTPRQKVIGVSVNDPIQDAKDAIISSKHSRICDRDESGNVAGILYAKDLFITQIRSSKDAKISLKKLMRDPYIVPETKHVDNLLSEFRKIGVHISVVVDEYGNFSGIVTLEDILESVFGEIIDEHDSIRDLPYRKLSSTEFVFEGDISIGEMALILKIEPFGDEGERLSGFILNQFGKIPREKEKFRIGNLEITVDEIRDRIIEKVLIRKLTKI